MQPLFSKILVANRGEIARRIFATCRKMGIGTVAVCSEADRASAHAVEADEVFEIGPAPARESYLNVTQVLEAARQSGAEAIHPGYGFLSENAGFARAVAEAGLVWIGPAPETIEAMGDKQRAREIAQAAGVPIVPGSARFDGVPEGLDLIGAAVGYPLLVKATGGGGGIGMRRVDTPEKLHAVVEATASMAVKAFGNGTVYLERFIPDARHVEIQVFGFGDGAAVHLFERDCSLQRRFQKVVEESPAPGLPAEVLDAMTKAAVNLCCATRYAGVGTIEYIYDPASRDFFFLEMNTRIQVEHPVTEAITGLDLVAMQIHLAAAQPMRLAQDQVTRTGHAIECRIYAENPERNFLPSPGVISRFDLPGVQPGLRIDAAYREGDTITPFYDPMIAKITVHGTNRDDARHRAMTALAAIRIDGPQTNLGFLLAILGNPDFADGNVHTAFLERHRTELLAEPKQSQSA